MKKFDRFRYLGRNGIVTTSIFLAGNEPIYMYRLIADEGKILTNGQDFTYSTDIFVEDLEKWQEVEDPFQKDNFGQI